MAAAVIQGVAGSTGVTFSATPSDGELIALLITSNETGGAISTPSGFTPGPAFDSTVGVGKTAALFWKAAASEASATYSIDVAPGNDRIFGWRISGADLASPVGLYGTYESSASSDASPAASSDVSMGAGSVALAITGRSNNATTGTTVSDSFVLVGNQPRACGASKEIASAGPVNCTFTWSSANGARYSMLVEIKAPAPAIAEAAGPIIEVVPGAATGTVSVVAEADGPFVELVPGAATATGGAAATATGPILELLPGAATGTVSVVAEATGPIIELVPGAAAAAVVTPAEAAGPIIELVPGAAAATGGAAATATGPIIELVPGTATAAEALDPLPIPTRQPLPVVLVEVDAPGGPLVFSDTRFVDASIGLIADPRLGSGITFERRITTIFWSGGSSRASIGQIDLQNNDGGLDYLLALDLRDVSVRILIGDDDMAFVDLTVVAVAVVERIQSAGEQTIRIVTAGRDALLAKAVSSTTYATGNQVGRVKPKVYGLCFGVPALATDIANLRFSVHDSASHVMQAVLDRGVTLTFTTQWVAYTSSPHFGFQLNQATSGRITSDVFGPEPNGSFSRSQLPNVVKQLLDDAGWSDYTAGDLATLQSSLGSNFRVGYWVDGSVSFKQVLDQVGDSMGGFWYADRLGAFRLGPLLLPSGTPAFDITEVELASEVSVSFDDAPGLSTTVAGLRNWHVYSTDELAGSVRDTATGIDLTKDYRERRSFSVHAAYGGKSALVGAARSAARSPFERQNPSPGSGGGRRLDSDQGHGTLIANSSGLDEEAARRATLWAAPRCWYSFSVELERTVAATLDPDDVVSLTVPVRFGGHRYGLDEKLVRVIGVRGVIGDGLVELTTWGAAPDA